MKIYVYPTGGAHPKNLNPYVSNLKKSLSNFFVLVQPDYGKQIPRMLVFLLSSFKADAYIFNWIENSASGKLGFLGAICSFLGLIVLKIRRAKIVWVFHNIHPHGGENAWTLRFQRFLFRHSTIIITHSQEAEEYAKQYAKCPVYFKNHPIEKMNYGEWNGGTKDTDYFYWGDISPYKGVVELLKNPLVKQSGRSFYVVGKCVNDDLRKQLQSLAVGNITFENRAASFREIAAQCKKSKYVIFPYVGNSISSSGVLMDTLLMGGTPVGPNRGAFADLAKVGCCLTYNNIEEIFSLPIGNIIKLESKNVDDFLNTNTWSMFGEWLYKELNIL